MGRFLERGTGPFFVWANPRAAVKISKVGQGTTRQFQLPSEEGFARRGQSSCLHGVESQEAELGSEGRVVEAAVGGETLPTALDERPTRSTKAACSHARRRELDTDRSHRRFFLPKHQCPESVASIASGYDRGFPFENRAGSSSRAVEGISRPSTSGSSRPSQPPAASWLSTLWRQNDCHRQSKSQGRLRLSIIRSNNS